MPHFRRWSDAQIDKLRELAEQGMTTREAAAVLGCNKNVVIGLAHRSQITWANRPGWDYCHKNKLNSGKGIKNPRKGNRRPRLDDIPKPEPRLIKLVELNGHDCHWPYGNGPYLFCAAERNAGSYYCSYHKVEAIRDFTREPRKKATK